MGIDRDAWISVWAGALGAIPAAVLSAAVAAWVAVTVLNRSNEHQQKLAAEAVAQQKALGERQLEEQRAESGRVREQAAIAGAVIAADDFIIAANESTTAVSKQFPVVKSAITRWRVELGIGPMREELQWWPGLLFSAATVAALENETGIMLNGTSMVPIQVETTNMFTTTAFAWASADAAGKDELHARLRAFRIEKRKFLSETEDWMQEQLLVNISLRSEG